jgi:hypothetical protein
MGSARPHFYIYGIKPKIMKVSEEQMYVRCLTIEAMVKTMVLKGVTDNESIVETISNIFRPETNEEMEQYSEAIIYAKFGVLN